MRNLLLVLISALAVTWLWRRRRRSSSSARLAKHDVIAAELNYEPFSLTLD
jgi:hypothetical protein